MVSMVPPRESRSRARTSQPSSSMCRCMRETKVWSDGRCTRCGQSPLSSSGAGLAAEHDAAVERHDLAGGQAQPAQGGARHPARLLGRDRLAADPAHRLSAGVRCPLRAAHREHRVGRCRAAGGTASAGGGRGAVVVVDLGGCRGRRRPGVAGRLDRGVRALGDALDEPGSGSVVSLREPVSCSGSGGARGVAAGVAGPSGPVAARIASGMPSISRPPRPAAAGSRARAAARAVGERLEGRRATRRRPRRRGGAVRGSGRRVGAAVEGRIGRPRPRGRGRAPRETTSSRRGQVDHRQARAARRRRPSPRWPGPARSTARAGAGAREHVPELVQDVVVAGIGHQHPVVPRPEEHAVAGGVPGLHDHACLLTPLSGPCRHMPDTWHHARPPSSPMDSTLSQLVLKRTPTYAHRATFGSVAPAVGGVGGRAGFVRRHRAAVATNTALVLAAGAVVAYAVAADGYQAHEAELNDGGIWVVHGDTRHLRPDQQADRPARRGRLRRGRRRPPLDVVQDGAAVAAIDRKAGTAQVDRHRRRPSSTPRARSPSRPPATCRWRGGTFASIDAETGDLWAVQLDPQLGKPLITAARRAGRPVDLGRRGRRAGGDRVRHGRRHLAGEGHDHLRRARAATASPSRAPRTCPTRPATRPRSPRSARPSSPSTSATGALAVIGGGSPTVPAGRRPAAARARRRLRAGRHPRRLLQRRPRDRRRRRVVDEGAAGRPTEPVRLGACSYAAWSGGRGTVTVAVRRRRGPDLEPRRQGQRPGVPRQPRPDRAQRQHQRRRLGPRQEQTPQKIDNWNAFTRARRTKDEDKENEEQSAGRPAPRRRRSPTTTAPAPGRTTVLHPLDNDSAPEGRLLSIVDVDQPAGGADGHDQPRRPDHRAARCRTRPADTSLRLLHRRRPQQLHRPRDGAASPSAAARRERAARRCATASSRARGGCPPAAPSTSRCSPTGATTATATRSSSTRRPCSAAARHGRGRPHHLRRPRPLHRLRARAADRSRSSTPSATAGRRRSKQTMSFDVQERLDRETFPADRRARRRPRRGRPADQDPPARSTTCPAPTRARPTPSSRSAARSPAQTGATIKTDLENGIVTFTGRQARHLLPRLRRGLRQRRRSTKATVRIDVRPRPKSPGDPVAMPDTLTVFGQAAGIVDVLANDLDPAGGLLAVQRADADNPNQLDVAIIDGRWLRISARQGDLVAQPAARPLHDQQRHPLRHRGRGHGQPAAGPGRQHAGDRRRTACTCAPARRSPRRCSTTTSRRRATGSPWSATLPRTCRRAQDRCARIDVKGDVGHGARVRSQRALRRPRPQGARLLRDPLHRPLQHGRHGARSAGRDHHAGRRAQHRRPSRRRSRGASSRAARSSSGCPAAAIDPDGDPVTVTGITSAPRLGRVVSYGGNFLRVPGLPAHRPAPTSSSTR